MNASLSSHFPAIRPRLGPRYRDRPASRFKLTHDTWPKLWRDVATSLHHKGYQNSTLILYRQVIRSFSRFVEKPPNQVAPRDIKNYLWSLVGKPYTWHWTSMNISVLRTVFDKLAGLKSLNNQRGPRRKLPLPEYLSRDDITRMFSVATTLRDQLVLAFLYGCGLKVSELQQIRWRDIQPDTGLLLIASRYRSETRRLILPISVIPILKEGIIRCPPEDYIFPGAKENRPLSARAIQLIVRNCAKKASFLDPTTRNVSGIASSRSGIQNLVTPQLLRNSYAVHALESGATIRQVQDALDHQNVETTMRYEACLNRATIITSPADAIRNPEPHTHVKIDHAEKLIETTIFPMVDPNRTYLNLLKTQLSSGLLSLRQYINSE